MCVEQSGEVPHQQSVEVARVQSGEVAHQAQAGYVCYCPAQNGVRNVDVQACVAAEALGS